MQLPQAHLRTIAFLCLEKVGVGGARRVPVATAFFVMDRSGDEPHPMWLVTARHCIEEARASGSQMFVRINTPTGFEDAPTEPDDWHVSHDADVAVGYWPGGPMGEIVSVPLDQFVDSDYRYRGASDLSISSELTKMGGQQILVGQEVFFVGLFSQHAGKKRNLPIARFGVVARPPIEPISIERESGSVEEIEGYLVEARSWGGHSGSPVFWYYPISEVHWFDDPNTPPPNREARRRGVTRPRVPVSREGGLIALLGLVSAHFDIPQEAETEGDILGKVVTNVNAGIAVVTPAHKIRDLIESEPVREEQEHFRDKDRQEPAATYDVVKPEGPDDDFARFEELARKVISAPKDATKREKP